MTRFYLLRHGETDWNRDGNRYCGRTDIGLSTVGKEQVVRTAERLSQVKLDALYCSPLQRAQLSAKPISLLHSLDIQQDERIIEIDFGLWEGLTVSQIKESDPEGWNRWIHDPSDSPAGRTGETAAGVFERTRLFFEEACARHADQTVAVVAHNTLLRIYVAGLLEMPLRNYRKLSKDNTGITILDLSENGCRLVQLNG